MMFKKAALLEAIAGKNRGLLATQTEKIAILAAIAQLEELNPHPRPLEQTELLDGHWRLLYTTSQELLNLDMFPMLKLGEIYQSIRVTSKKVYNLAQFYGIPYLESIVTAVASFETVSDRRVNVKFERGILGAQRIIKYKSPDDLINRIEQGEKFWGLDFQVSSKNQSGWLEVTYLDQDLRIGRGNQGNVFVLTKVR